MKSPVLLLSILAITTAVQIPSNFQKCNRKQPDFDDCMVKAARHAVTQLTKPYEEINIPSLDPLKVSEATLDGVDGPVSVTQKFTNCDFYGLNKFQIEKFYLNLEKKYLEVKGTFPRIVKKCDYQVKGRVLVVPVNGEGNSTITLKNLKITARLTYEEAKKTGRTYIKFVSSDLTMDPELVTYNFLNRHDRRRSDLINPILNTNWKEIFEDVKGGYTQIISQIVVRLVNGFFSKVSLEEALD